MGLRSRVGMGVGARLLEPVVWNSASSESAGQSKSPDAARSRASDGDGGTRARGKSGPGDSESADDQSRLRRLRSAARIGTPPRSPLENDASHFTARRSPDRSATFNH